MRKKWDAERWRAVLVRAWLCSLGNCSEGQLRDTSFMIKKQRLIFPTRGWGWDQCWVVPLYHSRRLSSKSSEGLFRLSISVQGYVKERHKIQPLILTTICFCRRSSQLPAYCWGLFCFPKQAIGERIEWLEHDCMLGCSGCADCSSVITNNQRPIPVHDIYTHRVSQLIDQCRVLNSNRQDQE